MQANSKRPSSTKGPKAKLITSDGKKRAPQVSYMMPHPAMGKGLKENEGRPLLLAVRKESGAFRDKSNMDIMYASADGLKDRKEDLAAVVQDHCMTEASPRFETQFSFAGEPKPRVGFLTSLEDKKTSLTKSASARGLTSKSP